MVLLTSSNSRFFFPFEMWHVVGGDTGEINDHNCSLLFNLDDSWMPVKSPQFIWKVLA